MVWRWLEGVLADGLALQIESSGLEGDVGAARTTKAKRSEGEIKRSELEVENFSYDMQ